MLPSSGLNKGVKFMLSARIARLYSFWIAWKNMDLPHAPRIRDVGICPLVDRGRKPGKAVTLTCLRRLGSHEKGLGFTWIPALSLGRTTKCFKGRLGYEGPSHITDIAQPLVSGLVARPR